MKIAAVLMVIIAALGFCLAGCDNVPSNALSDFQIVYCEIDRDELACLQKAGYDDGCDFYLYCAERLQQAIKSEFGVELPVRLDTSAKESACEILIGKTNRSQTSKLKLSSLNEQDYLIAESGGKLAVCGGSYGETWQAVGALADTFKSDSPALTEKGVKLGVDLRGSLPLITIACIGDSLTWGSQSVNEVYLSYPAILQRALWKNCLIKKFANPGKTMNSLVDYSPLVCGFTKTGEWNKCLDEAETFDVALIMLGTNDSYCINMQPSSDRPWLDNYEQGFTDSFLQMLESISGANSDVKYVLMNCPRVYANGYNTGEICRYQANCVTEAQKLGYDIDLYDMASATLTLNQSVYYDADGLHFNTKGYYYVANLIKNMLSQKTELEI